MKKRKKSDLCYFKRLNGLTQVEAAARRYSCKFCIDIYSIIRLVNKTIVTQYGTRCGCLCAQKIYTEVNYFTLVFFSKNNYNAMKDLVVKIDKEIFLNQD